MTFTKILASGVTAQRFMVEPRSTSRAVITMLLVDMLDTENRHEAHIEDIVGAKFALAIDVAKFKVILLAAHETLETLNPSLIATLAPGVMFAHAFGVFVIVKVLLKPVDDVGLVPVKASFWSRLTLLVNVASPVFAMLSRVVRVAAVAALPLGAVEIRTEPLEPRSCITAP